MHCWPEMARSARVLQYWLICTYKEGWSSNHISILQWSHIYISRATVRSTYQVQETFTYWDVFKRFSDFDLWWPHMTSMENIRDHLPTKGYQQTKFEVQASFTVLRYHVYKVFSLLTLVTLIDLWPPWKTIGIIYPPRATNIPSLKFRQLSHLEISCLQGCQTLTSGDLKWLLTTMENNRDHLPTKGYQKTKFEVQATFTCWDISVYKVSSLWPLMTSNDLWPPWKTIGIIYPPRATNIPSLKFRQLSLLEIQCLQGFQSLTSGDLKWPLTSMENNSDHLPTKGYQHTKFEVQATFISWDIVFTSKASHTHTHTHIHTHAITIA